MFSNIISNLVFSANNLPSNTQSLIPLKQERIGKLLIVLKNVEEGEITGVARAISLSCFTTLRSAITYRQKDEEDGNGCSRIGLQNAMQALGESGIEGKDLEVKKPSPGSLRDSRAYMNRNKPWKNSNRKRKRS